MGTGKKYEYIQLLHILGIGTTAEKEENQVLLAQ